MDADPGQQSRRLANDRAGKLPRGNRPLRVIQHGWTRPPQGGPTLLHVDPLSIMHQNANVQVNPNDLHTNLVAILMLQARRLAMLLVLAPSCHLDRSLMAA